MGGKGTRKREEVQGRVEENDFECFFVYSTSITQNEVHICDVDFECFTNKKSLSNKTSF